MRKVPKSPVILLRHSMNGDDGKNLTLGTLCLQFCDHCYDKFGWVVLNMQFWDPLIC